MVSMMPPYPQTVSNVDDAVVRWGGVVRVGARPSSQAPFVVIPAINDPVLTAQPSVHLYFVSRLDTGRFVGSPPSTNSNACCHQVKLLLIFDGKEDSLVKCYCSPPKTSTSPR